MQKLLKVSESAEVVRLDLADWKNGVKKKGSWTYFVGCNDMVKIGSASDPIKRLCTMQVGNPYQLDLIAVSSEPEINCHMRFCESRIRGEWFGDRTHIERELEKEWLERYGQTEPFTVKHLAAHNRISEATARKAIAMNDMLKGNLTLGIYNFWSDLSYNIPNGLILFSK